MKAILTNPYNVGVAVGLGTAALMTLIVGDAMQWWIFLLSLLTYLIYLAVVHTVILALANRRAKKVRLAKYAVPPKAVE